MAGGRRLRTWTLGVVAGAMILAPAVEATITEQRARLPPPADCEDIVEGVWKAHRHRPDQRAWRIFTLTVRRVKGSPTELIGTIRNEGWNGGRDREEPGSCQGLRYHWIVSMDARGTIRGEEVIFSGVGQWRLDSAPCGSGPWGYNLDSFSGVIDQEIEEFQSVNNDGGTDINVPTVFRRIRCFSPTAQPHIEVTPPPFFPNIQPRSCL